MAYTTPRTWVAGETVTATILNAHVRDNMTDLRTAKHCRAYATGTRSLTNNTFEAITFWRRNVRHRTAGIRPGRTLNGSPHTGRAVSGGGVVGVRLQM